MQASSHHRRFKLFPFQPAPPSAGAPQELVEQPPWTPAGSSCQGTAPPHRSSSRDALAASSPSYAAAARIHSLLPPWTSRLLHPAPLLTSPARYAHFVRALTAASPAPSPLGPPATAPSRTSGPCPVMYRSEDSFDYVGSTTSWIRSSS